MQPDISKLMHDLKNDFLLIRAAAGSIKKNTAPSEIVEKKILTINQALDQAIERLESFRVASLTDKD